MSDDSLVFSLTLRSVRRIPELATFDHRVAGGIVEYELAEFVCASSSPAERQVIFHERWRQTISELSAVLGPGLLTGRADAQTLAHITLVQDETQMATTLDRSVMSDLFRLNAYLWIDIA